MVLSLLRGSVTTRVCGLLVLSYYPALLHAVHCTFLLLPHCPTASPLPSLLPYLQTFKKKKKKEGGGKKEKGFFFRTTSNNYLKKGNLFSMSDSFLIPLQLQGMCGYLSRIGCELGPLKKATEQHEPRQVCCQWSLSGTA